MCSFIWTPLVNCLIRKTKRLHLGPPLIEKVVPYVKRKVAKVVPYVKRKVAKVVPYVKRKVAAPFLFYYIWLFFMDGEESWR